MKNSVASLPPKDNSDTTRSEGGSAIQNSSVAMAPVDTIDEMRYDKEGDSKRLKSIYSGREATEGFDRKTFAAAHGFKSAGNLSHYLNGINKLSLETAISFARALGCDIADFSPYWAAQAKRAGVHTSPTADGEHRAQPRAESPGPIAYSLAAAGIDVDTAPDADIEDARARREALLSAVDRTKLSKEALELALEFDTLSAKNPARLRVFVRCISTIAAAKVAEK
jgi:hypothetical protein